MQRSAAANLLFIGDLSVRLFCEKCSQSCYSTPLIESLSTQLFVADVKRLVKATRVEGALCCGCEVYATDNLSPIFAQLSQCIHGNKAVYF
jgi:hypothetical protein